MTDDEELVRQAKDGDVFAMLELAERSAKSGDLVRARERFEWIADNCDNASAALEVARLAYESDDFGSITEWLSKAAAAPDAVQWFWEDLAKHARSEDGDTRTKAKSALQTAADQGDAQAMLTVALLAKEQGRMEVAVQWYRRALAAGLWWVGDSELHQLVDDGDYEEDEVLDEGARADDLLRDPDN